MKRTCICLHSVLVVVGQVCGYATLGECQALRTRSWCGAIVYVLRAYKGYWFHVVHPPRTSLGAREFYHQISPSCQLTSSTTLSLTMVRLDAQWRISKIAS